MKSVIIVLTLLSGLIVLKSSETAAADKNNRISNPLSVNGCCQGKRGNVEGTGIIDLFDLSALINYLTGGGFVLPCHEAADVDANETVELRDLSALVKYLTGGNFVLLDCPVTSVTDIDGNVYQIVTIGSQVWMAENLRVTHYRNGDTVTNVTDGGAWAGLGAGAYCDYGNDTSYVSTYGRLYNWFAAVDSRNIAPAGWHVPSDPEFKVLEMYLGMSQASADSMWWRGSNEANKLKEVGTVHWPNPNPGATNVVGFTALPAGFRGYDGDFNGSVRSAAYFWSTTEYVSYDNSSAYGRWLGSGYSQINRSGFVKQNGFSIRCIKDN